MTDRIYVWYVEPLDSHTNEVIAKQLIAISLCCTEVCADRKRHELWTCSHQFAMSLVKSKEDLNLRLKIWGKEGRNGKIHDKTFLFSEKWNERKRAKKRKAKTAN